MFCSQCKYRGQSVPACQCCRQCWSLCVADSVFECVCCRQCRGSVLQPMNESVEMLQTVLAFVCWRKCKCVCVTDSVGVCNIADSVSM